MTQLDEQLEEIGLECLTARWLSDFLGIPRGRVYRVVQLMGAEPIGHTGRAAIYDADTIIGLASFLYGQGRFSSHTGRLPKGGLERLKHHLGYAAEPQPQRRRPAAGSRDRKRDRRTAEAEKMREEYDRKRYPSLYEDEPSA